MINTTDTPSPPPAERANAEPQRTQGRDELVVRLDWSTLIVAAAAFALGVLVGVVLD